MRLRLFDRIRRLTHRRRPSMPPGSESSGGAQGRHRRGQRGEFPPAPSAVTLSRHGSPATAEWPTSSAPPATLTPPSRPAPGSPSLAGPDGFSPSGASLAPRPPAAGAGAARARIREAPQDAAPVGVDAAARPAPARPYAPRPHWYEAARLGRSPEARAGQADARAADIARVAAGVPRQHGGGRARTAGASLRTRLPFAAPHSREQPLTADGRRNCGSIERILWRQWDTAAPLPAEVVEAVDRLAELPEAIKERLAEGLDAIFIGPGGVPELDDMTALRGVPLPAGRATWDACAGAYGERKIVVGSQPSPTPDVMCHEVGHALDDLDSPPGKWQSDSAEFRMLYDQCQPHLASDFHRQPGGLGRKEFFADAFAAIASRQRPALVDMLSGDTRTALRVMLYFNRRYGI
jgi:hypothetical protein